MKFVIATLAALAVADQSDFPKDDSFHADCHVSAQFDGMSCDSVYTLVDAEVRRWGSSTTSPAGGEYQLYEESSDSYLWSKRLTKDEKYTDDQMFDFVETNAGCNVTGHSRSESMSVYDYSVNFCNLWNVYNGVGSPFTYSVGVCGYPADDPVTTCARY